MRAEWSRASRMRCRLGAPRPAVRAKMLRRSPKGQDPESAIAVDQPGGGKVEPRSSQDETHKPRPREGVPGGPTFVLAINGLGRSRHHDFTDGTGSVYGIPGTGLAAHFLPETPLLELVACGAELYWGFLS